MWKNTESYCMCKETRVIGTFQAGHIIRIQAKPNGGKNGRMCKKQKGSYKNSEIIDIVQNCMYN